jgi:hypothetical protein
MRPIGNRENRVTMYAVQFATAPSDALLAGLKGSGDLADAMTHQYAREGARRVLRHRGYMFSGGRLVSDTVAKEG